MRLIYAEDELKTNPYSPDSLNALAIDEPFEIYKAGVGWQNTGMGGCYLDRLT